MPVADNWAEGSEGPLEVQDPWPTIAPPGASRPGAPNKASPNEDLFGTTVVGAVRRHRRIAGLMVISMGLMGFLYGASRPKQAVATTGVVMEDPRLNDPALAAAAAGDYVGNQVSIMKLPTVSVHASARVAQLHPDVHLTTADFLSDTSVAKDPNSNLVTISFRNTDPRAALIGADTVVDAYTDVVKESANANSAAKLTALGTEIAKVDETITASGDHDPNSPAHRELEALQTRMLVVQNQGDASGVSARSPARLAPPMTSGRLRYGVLGLLVGLIPAAALSYLLEVRRRRFGDRLEPEWILSAPLIADVPDFSSERHSSDLPALDLPQSIAAEAFRFANASLAIRRVDSDTVVVAISSAISGEGKTTVAANIAITAAKEGRRVVAVDGDVAGQGLTRLFLTDTRRRPGLVDVIEGKLTVESAMVRLRVDDMATLAVLPAGELVQTASTQFDSPALATLFQGLRDRYDLVIIDTPALLQTAYATGMALQADAAVIVVGHGSSVAMLEDLEYRCRFAGTDLLGYVYNKAPRRRELGASSKASKRRRRATHPLVETPLPRLGR